MPCTSIFHATQIQLFSNDNANLYIQKRNGYKATTLRFHRTDFQVEGDDAIVVLSSLKAREPMLHLDTGTDRRGMRQHIA